MLGHGVSSVGYDWSIWGAETKQVAAVLFTPHLALGSTAALV